MRWRYDAQIAAQTTVTGDQTSASRAGFKILADYIFGNNTANNGDASKIAMTAPVVMTPNNGAETIDMTAPVLLQSSDEDNNNKADDANKQWQMQFIMPSQYDLQSLPKPNNPAVTLVEVPVKTFAVIEFSGRATPKQVAAKTAQLQSCLTIKIFRPFQCPSLRAMIRRGRCQCCVEMRF